MAQPMSGRDSAPRLISNAAVSMFKEEQKMSRKPAATATPAEQVVETTATVEPIAVPAPVAVPTIASDDLAYLISQRKAIAEQIKAAKAAKKGKKLNSLIADDATVPSWAMRYVLSRVRAHVKAGQTQDEALEHVFTLYRTAVEAALA